MRRTRIAGGTCALCAIAGIAAIADAGVNGGASGLPIVVPFDDAEVHVEFIYSDALYTGNLYFMGAGDSGSVTAHAPDGDAMGLGQFIFSNHDSLLGQVESLIGVFEAGDVLHFAYAVDAPPAHAEDIFRTDEPGDQPYFHYDPATGLLAIEDIRDPAVSDFDYDDLMFRVSFVQVPTPGAFALLGVAGLVGGKRRRRMA